MEHVQEMKQRNPFNQPDIPFSTQLKNEWGPLLANLNVLNNEKEKEFLLAALVKECITVNTLARSDLSRISLFSTHLQVPFGVLWWLWNLVKGDTLQSGTGTGTGTLSNRLTGAVPLQKRTKKKHEEVCENRVKPLPNRLYNADRSPSKRKVQPETNPSPQSPTMNLRVHKPKPKKVKDVQPKQHLPFGEILAMFLESKSKTVALPFRFSCTEVYLWARERNLREHIHMSHMKTPLIKRLNAVLKDLLEKVGNDKLFRCSRTQEYTVLNWGGLGLEGRHIIIRDRSLDVESSAAIIPDYTSVVKRKKEKPPHATVAQKPTTNLERAQRIVTTFFETKSKEESTPFHFNTGDIAKWEEGNGSLNNVDNLMGNISNVISKLYYLELNQRVASRDCTQGIVLAGLVGFDILCWIGKECYQ